MYFYLLMSFFILRKIVTLPIIKINNNFELYKFIIILLNVIIKEIQ
jgi:hypothetical protein